MPSRESEFPMRCPIEGAFIGYKFARPDIDETPPVPSNSEMYSQYNTYFTVVTLKIPEDAKRSSGFNEKCRCNKAFVEKIELYLMNEKYRYVAREPDTPKWDIKMEVTRTNAYIRDVSMAYSNYDSNFCYRVGEWVEVENFDENRWNTCAPGIHFFMTKEEAINVAYI